MFFENLREALASIFSNKMRSILTMIGIIIGISAVITITTIGNSIRKTISTTFNAIGGSSISMYVSARYPETEEEWENWVYPEMTEDDYVKQEDMDKLMEMYPEIKGVVSYEYLGEGTFYKNEDVYARVVLAGGTEAYLEQMKLENVYGRTLRKEDYDNDKYVCYISDIAAEAYFEGKNPIGELVEFQNDEGESIMLTVVGVYKYDQALFGKPDLQTPPKDRTTVAFIPISTAYKILGKDSAGYDYMEVLVDPSADISLTQMNIENYFYDIYADNPKFYVEAYNMASDLKIIDVVINVVTVAISCIAAISLLVGGVGVMNIMLVSITERTNEIGVRMAMGAKRKVIRTQFVIEAIMLCLIGGIIGIIFGVSGGYIIGGIAKFVINSMYSEYARFISVSVSPSFTAIIISLIFSMLTGVFFGYYPANKAAKMEVIDALRYE